MALIKCPNCGNYISSTTSNCPKCGSPVGNAGMQRKGSTTRVLDKDDGRTRVIYKKNNNPNKWLYAIIALLASILVGGGAYYFLNKEKDTPTTAMADDTPTTMTTTTGKEEPTTTTTAGKEEPTTTTTPVKQDEPVKIEEPTTTPTPVKQEEPAATPPPVKRNKVADGTYRLNGSITYKDTYYIYMEIHVKGNKVTGWHTVHNGENIPVNLSGSIDANGNMKLTEYKGGSTTGYYYTGNFDQFTYSGKYLCTFKNLPMRFSASTY